MDIKITNKYKCGHDFTYLADRLFADEDAPKEETYELDLNCRKCRYTAGKKKNANTI